MNTLLTSRKDIIDWLKEYKIKNYTLRADKNYGFVVDVEGDVDLEQVGLTWIAVKFNIVTGNFNCSRNSLTGLEGAPDKCKGFDCCHNNLVSLMGCPIEIDGDFYCRYNNLSSLIGGPQTVWGNYSCNNNSLLSLEGAPISIKGSFGCAVNPISSLKHCPEVIDGEFEASYCELKTLQYFPKEVREGYIDIEDNPLLGDKQKISEFEELKQILDMEKKAALEHKKLNRTLKKKTDSSKANKI